MELYFSRVKFKGNLKKRVNESFQNENLRIKNSLIEKQ